MKDLIPNEISRCSDYKCPTNTWCERHIQLRIDIENGNKDFPVTNFQGSQKCGLCDYFLNVDVDDPDFSYTAP